MKQTIFKPFERLAVASVPFSTGDLVRVEAYSGIGLVRGLHYGDGKEYPYNPQIRVWFPTETNKKETPEAALKRALHELKFTDTENPITSIFTTKEKIVMVKPHLEATDEEVTEWDGNNDNLPGMCSARGAGRENEQPNG